MRGVHPMVSRTLSYGRMLRTGVDTVGDERPSAGDVGALTAPPGA
jgi:hypothetical protein